jgi:hypothetical protein
MEKKRCILEVMWEGAGESVSQGLSRREDTVPDHDGGRPEEVNSCVLNSYMVYL